MGIEIINNVNVLIKDIINDESINAKKKKITQNIAKSVKIDGFRKGKTPLGLIESRYKEQILRDCEQEALNENINNHLKTKNIEHNQIIGNPMFLKYESKDNCIDFEVKLGLLPKVEVGDLNEFVPKIKLESITKEAVDERLAKMAKSSGQLKEIEEEKELENGDIANIDFEGFINGEAFEGGKASGYDLEIGSNSFIEGFEGSLIGIKKGQSKDINLTFPKNYVEHLAGKDVLFKVKLNAIKQRESVAIDDDFAKKILNQNEKASLEDLREWTKTQLNNEAKNKLFQENKPKLIENLLENIKCDLPDNVVEQEMDIIFRRNLQDIQEQELKELQKDKEKAKEKRESFKEEAQKSVKLSFIIDSISKKNNISVSDGELYQTLSYEAMMMGVGIEELIKNYQKNNLIPVIKMTILENKVLNNILETAIESEG